MNPVKVMEYVEGLEVEVEAVLNEHFTNWSKLDRLGIPSLMEGTLVLILAILKTTSNPANEEVLRAVQVYFDNYLEGVKSTNQVYGKLKALIEETV